MTTPSEGQPHIEAIKSCLTRLWTPSPFSARKSCPDTKQLISGKYCKGYMNKEPFLIL